MSSNNTSHLRAALPAPVCLNWKALSASSFKQHTLPVMDCKVHMH